MFFRDLFSRPRRSLSFEFFPPRNEQDLPDTKALFSALARFAPSFMTVTSGAEQKKRELSRELVFYVRKTLDLPVIAHQTCWGLSRDEIDQSLDELAQNGVSLVLALRGDPSKNITPEDLAQRGFENALEFTRYIATRGGFEVAVAGYPETHRDAASPTSDLEYLKQKVDCGAEVVLTQLFFEPSIFFRFVENAAKFGVTIPIIPGILPISTPTQLDRFVGLTGASVPKVVRDAVERYRDDSESLSRWGVDYAIEQCRALLEGGAKGIHLYTLNKLAQTSRIAEGVMPLL